MKYWYVEFSSGCTVVYARTKRSAEQKGREVADRYHAIAAPVTADTLNGFLWMGGEVDGRTVEQVRRYLDRITK